jgi:hypothetical protein
VDGWMGGSKCGSMDCLQKLKIIKFKIITKIFKKVSF